MKLSQHSHSDERQEQAFLARQFIVAATGVIYWLVSSDLGASPLPFLPILLAVFLNVLYYTLAAKRVFYPQVKWIQIPIDMALWTWLIHLTGGPWSLFYPLYAFEIMLSAVALSVAGCAYASATSIVLYSLECGLWPGPFAAAVVVPRLALFAGSGAVCAVLVRKLAANERTVRRLNEQLRHKVHVTTTEENAVLESMTSGLIGVDSEGRITMFNSGAEEITGLSAADALGRSCMEAFGAENPICGAALSPLSGEHPSGEMEVEVRLNGHLKRLAISCFALPDGFPTRSVCVFQDKTELRDLEQRTIRAETLSGLGAMAATLAHELRTPLTAIAGFAAILRERLFSSPREAEIAAKIERGVTSLETVTRQLLGFTETPLLSKSRVRVAEVVESAMEMLPEGFSKSVKVDFDGCDGSLAIDGDALQLRQAFLNLMMNACEASGESGEVRVSLRRSGNEAHVEVADNGPGVSQELSSRIFLPFFTTKNGGTGLGLSYSEKLIRAHGGQLTLDSAAGDGAVFTARLLLSDAKAPRRLVHRPSVVPAGQETSDPGVDPKDSRLAAGFARARSAGSEAGRKSV